MNAEHRPMSGGRGFWVGNSTTTAYHRYGIERHDDKRPVDGAAARH
jgi:hypothetical protein